jgi:predicted CXXCH cytochrome family protein
MKKILVALAMVASASTAAAQALPVATSLHDLREAPYVGNQSVCRYCHSAHWSNPGVTAAPLWARLTSPVAGYQLYTGTLTVAPTTVNANSLTCLSCHDGTHPFNEVYDPFAAGNTATLGTMTNTTFQAGDERRNLGVDLRTTHPVSIAYVPGVGQTQVAAEGFGMVFFGATATVECATCHNAHDNQYGYFLRTAQADICTACHIK